MAAVTLYNIAKVWGQQCDPVTRPGVILRTTTGWRDAKTGFTYGPGDWCVTYDGGITSPRPMILPPAEQNNAPVATVVDRACGGCRPKTVAPGTAPGAPPPAPGSPTRPGATRSAYPWWVLVLAALTLAQVVRNNGRG